MRLFGHHFHRCDDPWEGAPPWAVELRSMLGLLLKLERELETEMALDFTKAIAAAERQQGVTNSVLQVLTDFRASVADLSAKLAAAIAANDPAAQAAVQAQLDGLAKGIDDNDDKLAAAVAAPGAPGAPPVAPVALVP